MRSANKVGSASRCRAGRAYGDWGVAHDPFPGLVDVGSCREVHECVCAPDRGPLQLLHLLCEDFSFSNTPLGKAIDLSRLTGISKPGGVANVYHPAPICTSRLGRQQEDFRLPVQARNATGRSCPSPPFRQTLPQRLSCLGNLNQVQVPAKSS